jgi:hypothetical protein
MIKIKIRGDEGEIAGKWLKPYIVGGKRTFGLNPGERFALVLENRTGDVVEARIFDGNQELRFSNLAVWVPPEGYDSKRGHWIIEPRQEITALSGWVARGALQTVSVKTYVGGAFRTTNTAHIIVWRDLVWLLRDDWAQKHTAGRWRARWQLFPRFEEGG